MTKNIFHISQLGREYGFGRCSCLAPFRVVEILRKGKILEKQKSTKLFYFTFAQGSNKQTFAHMKMVNLLYSRKTSASPVYYYNYLAKDCLWKYRYIWPIVDAFW